MGCSVCAQRLSASQRWARRRPDLWLARQCAQPLLASQCGPRSLGRLMTYVSRVLTLSHHRGGHIGVSACLRRSPRVLTPFGITEVGTIRRSLVGRCSPGVLNALHHRGGYTSFGWDCASRVCRCSPPFGITEVVNLANGCPRWGRHRASYAFRHPGGGHRTTRRPLARVSVLNAFRLTEVGTS